MAGVCNYSKPQWYGLSNPAAISFCRNIIASISYSNRFMVKGLGTGKLIFSVPAGRASLAASWSRFGNADYCRHVATVGSAIPLSESVRAGINIDYISEWCAGDYGPWNRITFGAGIIIKTGEKGFASVNIYNPFSSLKTSNNLPSALCIEYSALLNRQINFGVGMEMTTATRPSLKVGLEYSPREKLFIRCGYSSVYRSFCSGIGYEIANIRMDVAFTSHERLGVSSSGGLVFTF